ncbi:winged helix-turn-helix domain-containing protein [Arenicella xantha]|uniref:DNA-binding winged helix-turn-helix (WHTH) protein n=1 Tax=Arenicella xantha TaxID=644221 RepID=A0A395JLY8_9GAMM|nr:winged helix-turn-helix domain-containing protein [Arenicella xantha]RBP50624.1 DNA-binding winged helix-turn-helix (wHTH) protein [Arenicella xantha]
MSAQYWVGEFFIDLSRNQITQNKQTRTIAPKALAVLTCLAKNQGEVVSQDELLAQVWKDTVVSPNTLQRSIAQLRKALGDDGKVQVLIKTHAKQGYSLDCAVRWQAKPSLVTSKDARDTVDHTHQDNVRNSPNKGSKRTRPVFILGSIVATIITIGAISYQYFSHTQNRVFSVEEITSLTATDDKEFDATYTPDGKYIVFHRYLDKQCGNKLWAKDISTQKEIQLTQEWAAYGRHSFSNDGKKLVFLATEACSAPVTQSSCYNLMSLDFAQAVESPQQPSTLMQCQNSVVKNPVWLNNNDIALLQKHSNRWKLISYSPNKNRSTDIYDLKDGNLIHFAYSLKDDVIAVTSIHNDGQQYIELLNPDGRIISSQKIESTPEIPNFRSIYPSFDPLNEQLVFSTGRQLFTLSYAGKITKISLAFTERMVQPQFHPNGKRMLMIKGPYDSDIVSLPLSEVIETNSIEVTARAESQQPRTTASFERSNLGEDYAVFQPSGELIAFWSERSGEEQVWISDGHGAPRQLTEFPIDTYIQGIDWAADGRSLLVSANNVLTQVFLDGKQIPYQLQHPVARLLQWDSANQSALLISRVSGIFKLVEVDLDSLVTRQLTDKTVLWALRSEDGRLIYKDRSDQFWQPGAAEDRLIEALLGQKSKAKSFVITGNVIYAINTDNQLWSYDLNTDTLEVLGALPEDVDYLTDINETDILMTIEVAAKKEVVELVLSD